MTATQAPTPGPLSVEITYEVYQDGDFCASSTRLQDAEHYAGLYGQDGPVKCQTVVSVRHDDFLLPGDARLAPTAPVEASGSERERIAAAIDPRIAGMDFCNYTPGSWMGQALAAADRVLALRPQPSGETREAVARLVDPKAWKKFDSLPNGGYAAHVTREQGIEWSVSLRPSLSAADAILALLSARPLALGGQQGERPDFVDAVDQFISDVIENGSVEVMDGSVAWNRPGVVRTLRESLKDCGYEIVATLEALSTTPARAEAQDEGAAGEPVAWRCMSVGLPDKWYYFDGPPNTSHLARDVQPLYAHPSPTPAADADRVRIAVAALEDISAGRVKPSCNEPGLIGRLRERATEALAALKSGGEVDALDL